MSRADQPKGEFVIQTIVHADGHESKWRHFRRMVDISNGFGQRHSCGENCASTSCYRGDGRVVISPTREGRRHGEMLCAGGENRTDFDDHSGGSMGNTLYDRRGTSGYTWRV